MNIPRSIRYFLSVRHAETHHGDTILIIHVERISWHSILHRLRCAVVNVMCPVYMLNLRALFINVVFAHTSGLFSL